MGGAASTILAAAEVYGLIGLGVAAVFLTLLIGRYDASARGSYAVRALLAPSVVLLWPLVIWRCAALERARAEAAR